MSTFQIHSRNCPEECLRPALIRGYGRQRICIVIAFKNGNYGDPSWEQLFTPPIRIRDGNDDFEDGHYELVLGAQIFQLTKSAGNYQEIPALMAVAVK